MKKNQVGITLPYFKIYYVATVTTVTVFGKRTDTDQRNRPERTVTGAHEDGQLIFDKYAKAVQWRESSQTLKTWACKKLITILNLHILYKN